jgi:uncharacterized membrane protein YphA (DoxX/SURF4 family)
MRIFKHIARILIGLTFMFSGFVKGIDPWGFAYKFTDYFHAMGLDWMTWSVFPLAILMAFAEFTMGVSFFFNLKIKFFSWLVLLFMIYFLGFTLWTAVSNPVTDCGCFGDALVISNWETFYKNVILIILAIIVFKNRRTFHPTLAPKQMNIFGIIIITGYIGSVYYSYNHEPIFDFRPYKVGVNITEAMKTPEGAQKEIYKNTFYYKNKQTGTVQKFTEQNYPWQDTLNWAYDHIQTELVQKGYKPPIHDFIIESRDGENVIDFFIRDKNYVFILVAYNLQKTNTSNMEKIVNLANWANEKSFTFIGLTSSPFGESDAFKAKIGSPFEFFTCDEITLKTIIRSNPGLLALKNGTIVDKWHFNDIPTPEEFSHKFLNK